MDLQELEDLISEAISDSLDMDWNSADGARAVMRMLADEGLIVSKAPARGTECAQSPTGFHIVDTSMESGPNNCFHCDAPMPSAPPQPAAPNPSEDV